MKRLQIVMALLLVLSSSVVESETRMAIGAWSKHAPAIQNVQNENHELLALEHNRWVIGHYKNSYSDSTVFVARNWRGPVIEHVNWTLSIGVSRGYDRCWGFDKRDDPHFCPQGFVGVEYDRFRLVPTIKASVGVIVFSPEIRF